MSALPSDRGLDAEGFIRREGSPSRVQPDFAGLVEAYVEAVRSLFGEELDSAYLYGSVPRGTALPGRSDLDGQVLLARPPTTEDRRALEVVEARLGATYPRVSTVEILLDARADLVDPAERHDGGFHVRVLCTPFWGPDAGDEVEPHRPDRDLARGIQGDWRAALVRLTEQATTAERGSPEEAVLCRATGRRLARVGFSWVLPRWGGWSSDPRVMAQVVGHLEPGWAAPMASAVRLGWGGGGTADVLSLIHI